jgi:2'-5' RNA ligase
MININKIVKELVTESLLQQKDVLERLSKHREFLKKQFLIDCLQELKIKTRPKVIFTKDKSKTETLGHNNLNDNQIVVFTMGRNMADCFRTISHELVHSKQNCDGRIDQNSGNTGSDIENEANSQAGIFLRDFGNKYPEIYQLSFDNELNEEGNYDKYQTLLKIRYPTHSSEGNYANDREKIYNQTVKKGGNIDSWNRIVANDQNRFLEEEKSNKREYGCLMLDVPFQNWQKVLSRISKEDLYEEEGVDTYGLEDEPHVTVIYGLHEEVKDEKLIKFVKEFCKSTPIEIEVTKMGVFKNSKFDVIKFDVESSILKSLNKKLSENFPYTSKFPNFEPHITIAYLKKGTSEKYLKELKEPVTKSLKTFVYSKADRSKIEFKID